MIKQSLLSAALAATVAGATAAPLTLEVFNPGEAAIFPVASVIVSGAKDAVLIDAQFSRDEALKLVEQIRAGGKHLTTVYVSHSDPDFYFGLDVIHAAFPDAKIVATPQTIAGIEKKKDAKVAFWGPILKDNAPQSIIVPQPLPWHTIQLEGQSLKIEGLKGATPDRSYVWIPSIKAVVGGVVLFNELHVWTADTQTAESRKQWLATLDGIAALKPATIVPGHFKLGTALTPDSIAFTRDYLVRFEAETARAANSAALIARMKELYPSAGLNGALDTSAKVAKGEMKW
ncbi:MBL fold metallo-hydrolase [Duganella violaceipulchra]|uniref:Glyoxylase-like metal-dependent hydrolase (Beta-lactamase superfamily II) n=1 Tax=Duganella violaceipulchra TaxID=2849652 RepID=A0AA41L3V0_9BURK|nr:MBL fold metallo-hydrolase [Duganella violaceicalia]MBV6324448.1 MBL fold metallo-hydrolase [Duganella violaceicalia]MCP2012052.1 glyoxylase-like metal-dependent hydrolase (beta-lactamase superfamily II) [Duganella violaceicalia]